MSYARLAALRSSAARGTMAWRRWARRGPGGGGWPPRHYAEHEGKPFYEKLIAYITACPMVAGVFEGTNAVDAVRMTMGATNPAAAEPGTVRGDLGLETGRNLIHGSDSLESAKRELADRKS